MRRNTLPAGGASILSQETGARGLPAGAVRKEGQEIAMIMITRDAYRHFLLRQLAWSHGLMVSWCTYPHVSSVEKALSEPIIIMIGDRR